ncbi:MAG: dockerin type I repeat-containing protein, partial [Oscillospiraceae bacterium]|nr:dockerin type I repeat-containing protein [Oscillospiraceae bacterium]
KVNYFMYNKIKGYTTRYFRGLIYMTNKNTISKAARAFTTRVFTGFVSAMMTIAAVPFFTNSVSASAASETAPVLNMRNTVVTNEDLEETRNVGVDLVLTNNVNGFRGASFGIQYDDRLDYTNFVPCSKTGNTFEVFPNEEESLIWFVSADGAPADATGTEDTFLTIYFDIPEETENDIFELNFIFTNLDGSQAYWYADSEADLMDEIAETSLNGKITYSDPAIAPADETGFGNVVSRGARQMQALANPKIRTCDVIVSDRYYRVTNIELGAVTREAVSLQGDVNADGEVDIRDVILCNRIYIGTENATAEQIQAGDVDGSGRIDLSDSMTILRKLVGMD